MNILFIGDIFASPGRVLVARLLQEIIAEEKIQLAIANAENSAGGFGITPQIAEELFSLGVDVIPISVADAAEIERSIATFAESPNGGLILTASALSIEHRDLVIALAARYKLPAVYWDREGVVSGGLIAYGPDVLDQYMRAANYVDRVLKGEKPADLPVQAPTKYELTINLKTAKALGLDVPPALLASADEVVE